MRSVFTSPRLENVEAVAKMLEEAGIEVRISQDRSYKGNRRRPFSYRDSSNTEPNPQVWVIKAEDQPKARAMLREAGLIDSTRPEFSLSHSYLPPSPTQTVAPKRDRRAMLVLRMRLLLLGIIVLVTILTLSGTLHRGG
jgi:hypothetical protein